ncbi:EKA-like protein [Blumeria hordei DH14]|uniref:EKA-like protein n=1 Tax=Blumeria graminis f. sp. hordei (strain DH14) TaxID=546991 RepID=N1J8G0_BLUG1|nr:EKA-like protein [Blumeria hordei DH14]
MLPVRKERPNAMSDITIVRPRMGKASSKGKKKVLPTLSALDTDMIRSVEIVEEFPQSAPIPHGIGESSKSSPTISNRRIPLLQIQQLN